MDLQAWHKFCFDTKDDCMCVAPSIAYQGLILRQHPLLLFLGDICWHAFWVSPRYVTFLSTSLLAATASSYLRLSAMTAQFVYLISGEN